MYVGMASIQASNKVGVHRKEETACGTERRRRDERWRESLPHAGLSDLRLFSFMPGLFPRWAEDSICMVGPIP